MDSDETYGRVHRVPLGRLCARQDTHAAMRLYRAASLGYDILAALTAKPSRPLGATSGEARIARGTGRFAAPQEPDPSCPRRPA